jgi:hypothetical protein
MTRTDPAPAPAAPPATADAPPAATPTAGAAPATGAPPAGGPTAGAPAADGRPGLEALGLAVGDTVRWRDRAGARHRQGTVRGRERDGSISVSEGARGASRALRVERLEVATRGPRGAARWESLAERAQREEQIPLWSRPAEQRLRPG